jgi:Domain of unknown function (DUF4145)
MGITFGHRQISKPDSSTQEGWLAYTCGHCGTAVSGAVVACGSDNNGFRGYWLQCPACGDGSFLSREGNLFPGAKFGPLIEGLPDDVKKAYQEARDCLSVNATTAAELICHKILMHVAVDKGAAEGQTFASYIDYLEKQGYVTPPMRGWVKLIKDHGNDSTHKLPNPQRKRAEGTLIFTAQLLRTVYEMEHLAGQFASPPAAP